MRYASVGELPANGDRERVQLKPAHFMSKIHVVAESVANLLSATEAAGFQDERTHLGANCYPTVSATGSTGGVSIKTNSYSFRSCESIACIPAPPSASLGFAGIGPDVNIARRPSSSMTSADSKPAFPASTSVNPKRD